MWLILLLALITWKLKVNTILSTVYCLLYVLADITEHLQAIRTVFPCAVFFWTPF